MRKTQKTIYFLIAGVCFYVSAASAQIGSITNVGPTVTEMDAITFNSSGTLFGATGGAGALYTVNPATGVATLVHAFVGASSASLTYGVNGLAFQPGTGTLYGSTSPDSPNSANSLVTITATGQVTVIGPSGTGRPYTNIAFAPNGTLYGWLIGSGATTVSAATINLATGAGTSLGSPQRPNLLPYNGLAVNSSGVIYAAANGFGGAPSCGGTCSGAFWTINPANGAPTTIGTLSGGPGVAPAICALAFSPTSGVLYGIEGGSGGGWSLITINASASPAITSVENAASNITPGLPNAGIAQGSIFAVYGSGLGPANISIASSAFQSTTLSDTSVAVTVGGMTVNALMYYTSAAQVAALLPSNTPTGTGTVTVTYNGETSATAPITVVANNLGIFTIDSTGAGPGIVTYPDYSLVSAAKIAGCGGPDTQCGAALPGDTLTLWATGLGPISGSDASGAGLGVNMLNIPLTLWLGGVQAPVVYQGRGCCIGEDQIAFTVPNNVPAGCAVPVVVQIGNEISNNVVMAVGANGSRDCIPTDPVVPASIEQEGVSGPITVGTIKLNHYSDGNGVFEDDGKASFQNFLTYTPGTQPFFVSWIDYTPSGTCLVYNNSGENTNIPVTSVAKLDAGATVKFAGPNGSVSLPENQSLNEFSPGNFLVPGVYTVTGTGGANVGPFSVSLTIPASPTLVSPVNNATVTRSNGLTVTWTGGGSGNVIMDLESCTDNTCAIGATAICSAPTSAGTFTIPPYVLLAFPAGSNGGFVLSTQAQASFTATGLNLGFIDLNRYNVAGFGNSWGSGSFTFK